MKKEVDRIPTSKIARSAITGITAVKAGMKHLSYIGKKTLFDTYKTSDEQERYEQEIGKLLYKALSQLRGTALKVAQMLSMENGLFPKAIRTELSKACHQVLPLNRALIYKALRDQFNVGYDKLFLKFNMEAFAAASLGQVHEALSFNGEELAVKIQYPGIASSIKSDIRLIRSLIPAFAASTSMVSKKEVFQTVIDEIEERLYEEVDYVHEAQQTEWFSSAISLKYIKIPKVIHELTGKRVITLEKLPGKHIQEWLLTKPSQDEKNHFGQVLFDFFIHSTFELKKIHADPHPGNFIFAEDSTLGVIDFGCVKTLDSSQLNQFCLLLNTLIRDLKKDHTREIVAIYQSMGILSNEVTPEMYTNKIAPLIKPVQFWFIEPFTVDLYDFSKKSPFPIIPPYESMSITQYFSNFPRDQVYFNRFYTGILFLLEQIGAVVKTTNSYIHY